MSTDTAAETAADNTAVDSAAGDSQPVLIFGRGALTRLADGRKTATISSEIPDAAPGDTVTATLPAGTPRLPLQITHRYPVDELAALPQIATQAGLELSAFTKCRTWSAYLDNVTTTGTVTTPAHILVLTTVGELEGEFPPKKRPTPKRKRQPPTPPKPKPAPEPLKAVKNGWMQIQGTGPVKLTPLTMVHPQDTPELQQRIAAVLARRAPSLQERRALAPVIGALLEKGKAGPAGLGKDDRERLRKQLHTAVAWLTQHQLLTHGHWNPKLLTGLRIKHATTRGGAPTKQ
ncbi:hypothetical protein [Pseudonocardia sp. ICBG601]|uniref:hypothetical protein n=1 Tax=Pseudonocardia sp. ICBG601 TaxID=2846759 RepID=UPI001CF69FA0|nr:hypothetical protein [Pseudonocardia sp. ICBG601]